MNLSFVTRAVGAVKLAAKANAPTIMVTTGVVAMGASVVTASRKTLSLEEILAPAVQALDTVEQATGHVGYIGGEYTKEKAQKDRYKIYGVASLKCVRHYAVPIVLFVGGTALVFGGHRIMIQRNAALGLAFTTVQQAFAKYRQNASEVMGPDFDRAMLKGFVTKDVIDPETGKTQTVQVLDWDGDDIDPYNRVFEQGESTMWKPDLGMNKDFLEVQRGFCQQVLNRQHYLYLSDVYKALGMEESPLSRLVGWKVDRLPDGSRNIPQISFGLDTPMADDWKYSQEHAIYLDFNCQGLIIGGDVQKKLEKAL